MAIATAAATSPKIALMLPNSGRNWPMKSVATDWPWAAMLRAETSASATAPVETPSTPRHTSSDAIASAATVSRDGTSRVKERGAPAGRSIASSQSRATSRAMAGNAGRP